MGTTKQTTIYCKKCKEYFVSTEDKLLHVSKIHPRKYTRSCKKCPNVQFSSKEEFALHISDVHEGQYHDSYMCSSCGKQFKTKGELTNHINSKCGTIKQFACKECGQELMSRGSLHNHMLRHAGEKGCMCGYCGKMFISWSQVRVHERKHTQEKLFKCNVCSSSFCHRQSLITHSSIHTGIKPYQCENCGRSFSCVGNLIKHRKTHADTCGIIPLTTHRVINPTTRMKVKINTPDNSKLKTTEKENELKLKIRLCKEKINNQQELVDSDSNFTKPMDVIADSLVDELMEIDTDEKKLCNEVGTNVNINYENTPVIKLKNISDNSIAEQEAACQNSEKVFTTSESLRQREDLHKVIRKRANVFICEKCGEQFKHKAKLNCHKKSQCGVAAAFECEICKKVFNSNHTRKAHMIVHDPRKKFLCKFCGKKFRWKGQLKIHERSHTGEKPYKCLYCPKSFAYRTSLMTHSTVHTGIKPHLCQACGSRFSCLGNLIKHRNTHASTCGAWTLGTEHIMKT